MKCSLKIVFIFSLMSYHTQSPDLSHQHTYTMLKQFVIKGYVQTIQVLKPYWEAHEHWNWF